jgi:hypothetical protein
MTTYDINVDQRQHSEDERSQSQESQLSESGDPKDKYLAQQMSIAIDELGQHSWFFILKSIDNLLLSLTSQFNQTDSYVVGELTFFFR